MSVTWKLPDTLPSDTICLTLELPNDEYYFHQLIGMLGRAARWNSYDRDELKTGKDVAALWTSTIETIRVCEAQESIIIREIIQNVLYGGDCTDREDDMALQIQTIDGVDYLVENCCGGLTRFWQLSGVSLDGSGSPVSLGDGGQFGGGFSEGGGASGSWEVDGVSSDNVTCYADLAVPYMLSRATAYAHAVIDWALLGWDALTPINEFVDAWRLGTAIIQSEGDLPAIQSQSKSAVSDALADTTVVNALKAAWTFTGVPSRSELQQWQRNAPFLVDNVPVRIILGEWATFSTMLGYRNDLALLAAQCESGVSVPPPIEFSYDWGRRYDMTITGTDGWTLTNSYWEEGLGVRGMLSSPPNDYQIILHKNISAILTGVRLVLDEPMNGDADSVRLGLSAGTTQILDAVATNEAVIVRDLDYTISANMYLLLREWEFANNTSDNFTQHLVYIDLFGTGSPPSGGTPIG